MFNKPTQISGTFPSFQQQFCIFTVLKSALFTVEKFLYLCCPVKSCLDSSLDLSYTFGCFLHWSCGSVCTQKLIADFKSLFWLVLGLLFHSKEDFFLCYLFSESFLKLQFPWVGVTSFCIVNVCFRFAILGILFSAWHFIFISSFLTHSPVTKQNKWNNQKLF